MKTNEEKNIHVRDPRTLKIKIFSIVDSLETHRFYPSNINKKNLPKHKHISIHQRRLFFTSDHRCHQTICSFYLSHYFFFSLVSSSITSSYFNNVINISVNEIFPHQLFNSSSVTSEHCGMPHPIIDNFKLGQNNMEKSMASMKELFPFSLLVIPIFFKKFLLNNLMCFMHEKSLCSIMYLIMSSVNSVQDGVVIRDAKSKFSKSGVFRKKSGVYQEIFFLKSGGKSGAFYTKSQGLLDDIPLD